MNIFIVHAHAEPKSFNGALTSLAVEVLTKEGHQVRVSDLYAMGFDPVSDRRNFTAVKDSVTFRQQTEEVYATETNGFSADIQAEMEKLDWCDVLIFQFPLWWFGLPAILKGWVDRVFAMGRIYGRGKWYDNGAFHGKRAMLSVTTGGSDTTYSPTGLHGDINQILYPINHGIFRFVGFDVLPPIITWSPAHISPEQRQAALETYRHRLLTLASTPPIPYPSLAEFDERLQRTTREKTD